MIWNLPPPTSAFGTFIFGILILGILIFGTVTFETYTSESNTLKSDVVQADTLGFTELACSPEGEGAMLFNGNRPFYTIDTG